MLTEEDFLWLTENVEYGSRRFSDLAPANIFLFRNTYEYRISDRIPDCLEGISRSGAKFALPLKPLTEALADKFLRLNDRQLGLYPLQLSEFNLVSNRFAAAYSIELNNSDYLYSTKDLKAYPGYKHRKTRQYLNALDKAKVLEISKIQHAESQLEIVDLWAAQRPQTIDSLDANECKEAICRSTELNLNVMLFKVRGVTSGILIYDLAIPETILILFAKVVYGTRGLTAFMYRHVALLHSERPILNLCQDLGLPGLRNNKLALRPIELLDKLFVTFR